TSLRADDGSGSNGLTCTLPFSYRHVPAKTPHSVPTFLVDGAVAGTWRYEKGKVHVSPFEPLPSSARREVDEEAARLAAFHA
ncbi:MAG TPA: crosslink repair DNA glycosylase YcaQ family protein, partial [Acidimicrobiales bacterium]|nr:crosslink repair DNA glycosylase YcaQ family protein [Acidimicrobiales bacterium]